MTSEHLTGSISRPIAFNRSYLVFGGVKLALFLSQAIYWCDTKQGDWFYKTAAEWEAETGLTKWEQDAIRKALRDLGITEEDRMGPKGVLHFRVDYERLKELLDAGEVPSEGAEVRKTRYRKNKIQEKQDTGKPEVRSEETRSKSRGFPASLTYSENTTENTTETTCSDALENGSVQREIKPDGTCRLTEEELQAQEKACAAIGKLAVNLKDAERRAVSRLFASGCSVALWEQVVSETATAEVGSLVYFVKICETRLKEIQSVGEQAREGKSLPAKLGSPRGIGLRYPEAADEWEANHHRRVAEAKAFKAEREAAMAAVAEREAAKLAALKAAALAAKGAVR